MNETTNRMKRAAIWFLTVRLHALCVAACRRLLAQAGLASDAAVGYPLPAMETLHPAKPPTPGSARNCARDWRGRMPAFLFAGLPPTSRCHPQFRAGIHERKSSSGRTQPRASNLESGDVTPFSGFRRDPVFASYAGNGNATSNQTAHVRIGAQLRARLEKQNACFSHFRADANFRCFGQQ